MPGRMASRCLGQAGEVADDAATKQAEEIDHVLGADDVRVPDDEQSGRGDRPDCLIWHILRVAIHLLGKERREVLRVGRESEVLVVAGGFVHCSPSAPMTGTCCKSSAVASSP
jgi:hypothetical protein